MGLPSNAVPLLSHAFVRLLGDSTQGSVAYVRCLHGDIARELAADPHFAVGQWKIAAVTDKSNEYGRCITADQAVELREDKAEPLLLLVDVESAGAGVGGVYSAAREVSEGSLFDSCLKLARDRLPHGSKGFAEAARRKARHTSRNQSL